MFTFAEDDLCEWMTEADVTEFVREAYAVAGVDWDGIAATAAPSGSAWDLPGRYCQWKPTGGGYVIARGLSRSHFANGAPVDFSEVEDEGLRFPPSPGSVSGHRDFPDDVVADDDWTRSDLMLSHMANRLLHAMGWIP